VPDEAHFEDDLVEYFPAKMRKKYAAEIGSHRLRREIIARVVANDLVNRGGPAFVSRLQDLTGRTAADVVRAFTIARDGYELGRLYAEIDALDNKIDGEAQLGLYAEVGRLIDGAAVWFLKNADDTPIGVRITALREARRVLEPQLPGLLPAFLEGKLKERAQAFFKAGASTGLADRLALLDVAEMIPDIALVARQSGADLATAAKAFFAVTRSFRIGRIEEAVRSIAVTDYYDGLALSRAVDTIGSARRGIAVSALRANGRSDDPVRHWLEAGGERVARARERLEALTEGGDITVSRLSVASGLMADLTAQ
jgi:glutamate dehydrogenase